MVHKKEAVLAGHNAIFHTQLVAFAQHRSLVLTCSVSAADHLHHWWGIARNLSLSTWSALWIGSLWHLTPEKIPHLKCITRNSMVSWRQLDKTMIFQIWNGYLQKSFIDHLYSIYLVQDGPHWCPMKAVGCQPTGVPGFRMGPMDVR